MKKLEFFVAPLAYETAISKYWDENPPNRHRAPKIKKPVRGELHFVAAQRIYYDVSVIVDTPAHAQKVYQYDCADYFYANIEINRFPKPSSTYAQGYKLSKQDEGHISQLIDGYCNVIKADNSASQLRDKFYVGEVAESFKPISKDYYLHRYNGHILARAAVPPGLQEGSNISYNINKFESNYVLVPIYLSFTEGEPPAWLTGFECSKTIDRKSGEWNREGIFDKLKKSIFKINDIC